MASSTGVVTTAHLSPSKTRTFGTSNGGGGTRVSYFSVKYFPVPRKPYRRVAFVVRSSSSSEVSAEETSAADTSGATENGEVEEEEEESQQLDQVPPEPPSLISALNVEKALRGIAITDVDYYGILGLQKGCSYDQVQLAYRNKVGEVLNQQLPEELLQTKLEQLKESYSILSSVEERRLYDWSLARTETPERYKWPFEVDITQTPNYGTPPPQEPEDVGPTRMVGYFIFGSFVLSIILQIVLNTI